MSTFVKDPITGKDKAIIADDGIYSTITGRKIAYVENGEIISVFTGKAMSVVATGSNGESVDLTNLIANNIKTGVTINGVTGTFTNDANAVSADIRSGKTAYVKGSLVTGNMQNVSLYQDGYLTIAINSGYSVGGSLTLTDSNLLSANILQGKTIFGVSGSIDLSNLLPENIKSGVTINGITGTYEGGGSTADKQVLVLSGFSSAETAIYGVDLNGEYVLVSADVPSYDRVWVCEANGVQLMYKSAWGYWGLINNTASGGNTYTYGEGNNPYKADGSSAQWQTQGANISATAVVKGSNNGGGTGGGGTSNADYKLTVSNADNTLVNGNYIEYTGTNYIAYKHETNDIWLWRNTDYMNGMMTKWMFTSSLPTNGVNSGLYGSSSTAESPIGLTWTTFSSPSATDSMPIVEEYSGNASGDNSGSGEGGESGGGGTSNADYVVSGAVSYPEVNGEYVQDGEYNGKPKYINTTSNATYTPYIQCDSLLGWAIFYPNQPRYSTNDTTSATPPVSATWTYGSETVTVTQG